MSIPISCPHCRRPYRLKDKFAGKRVRCRECRRLFSVPGRLAHQRRRTAAGDAVYRYEEPAHDPKLTVEATPFLAEIERHINGTIGQSPMVLHELVSEEVHIDLHLVPPTHAAPSSEHPLGTHHYTVVTSGMSSRPMFLPDGADSSLRYAELMISLPGDWPGLLPDGTHDDEVMQDDKYWWPVRTLKSLARIPHRYSTYFASGHTIPTGDPPEPFAPNTSLCCAMLWPSVLSPNSRRLIINDDIVINFYAVWPIYREEMELKLQEGANALAEKFDAIDLTDLIDIRRKNVCQRGFWPFHR